MAQEAPQIYFQEVQRFREPWLWTLLGGSTLLTMGVAAWLIVWPIEGEEGIEPMALSWRILIAAVIVVGDLLLVSLIWIAKLQVEVTSEGLFLRFVPFHRKVRKIPLDTTVAITPVEYQPIQQYGGWGLRKVRYGTAYNVRGNMGVRLDYDNDCHLLIGSQYPFELSDALHLIWTPPKTGDSNGFLDE